MLAPGRPSVFVKSTNEKSKTFKLQAYKPGMCIPVFPASSLLADKRHQFFLEQLGELSKLPVEHHKTLYERLIHRFVEFVQVLPDRHDNFLCGLMNNGLLRGINSLYQFTLDYSDATPLERYAVFTAAMLKDIASVVVNQKIFITDDEGATTKIWDPFEGTLQDDKKAEFYKIIPLSSLYQRINHSITPLLARQLLSKQAFAWITSDAKIFVDWLDVLRGDDAEGGGRIVRTVQLIKHKIPENLLINTLPAVAVTLQESPATLYGDGFFTWLKNGIIHGEIKVNTPDANVHVIPQGVFIEKGAIFKQYVDLHVNVPVNMFSVFQQLGNLFGLTKLGGDDYRIMQLFSEFQDVGKKSDRSSFASPFSARANQIREGMLIGDPGLIFMNGKVPSTTSYLKSRPSSKNSHNLPILTTPNQKNSNQHN